MLDFITRIFGRESNASKNVAKERLRLVLVHDRSSVSPQILQDLKADLIKVISSYMEIDEEALEVNFENSENQVALIANIPIKNVKRPANVV
ncbi:MAG: cell division topological specificity factor MinE [Actinobacteria bacterium]|nr:cell division topological specificity factor MinE [Actinomycetota bacterium]